MPDTVEQRERCLVIVKLPKALCCLAVPGIVHLWCSCRENSVSETSPITMDMPESRKTDEGACSMQPGNNRGLDFLFLLNAPRYH